MSNDLSTLISKLNPICRRALEGAASLCVNQTHYNVEIEHLLLKLLEEDGTDLLAILHYFELDPSVVVTELTQATERFKRGNGRTPALSPHLSRLIESAWLQSSLTLEEGVIRSAALMLALSIDDSLRGLVLASSLTLLRLPSETLRLNARDIIRGTQEQVNRRRGGERGSTDARTAAANSRERRTTATPSLDQYTIDLTALAAEGKIDQAIGRDNEIRQVVDILLRRRQNNPILTGEAGVGKTAVVEGFADRVARGDVPPLLRNASVRTLDLGLLQAGAGVKGEFEHRLKTVIEEVKSSSRPIILFIDEAHTIIGAGGQAGQGDAANLLKPALARGELRTIAATTWAEYKKYIEKDPALARRFQVVKVEEPSEESAIAMLRSVARKLETHHGVRILDEAVKDAVALSHRYLPDRRLPDKAISVLDTACARVAVGQNGTPSAIEDARRTVEELAVELRVARRDQLTNGAPSTRIADVTRTLASARARVAELEDRWKEEAAAVAEIHAVHDQLDGLLESEHTDEAERERLNRVLGRLEKGLEAIQADFPMIPTSVDSEVVASVISGWTGIPVGRMMTDEIHTILTLRERLGERVVGQPEALDSIAKRIRTYRAGLDDPGKPVGVFLLVGPSGVGKTETAATLAEVLFGGERNLITVNMSEFQEAHTVSSLKGAPPGYVGYGTGGVLTEAVRRRPYSVVLLDEVEKAHPDVLELFYQVFDKGNMEDGEGVAVDFKNTVILLTSNVGSDEIIRACRPDVRRPTADELAALIRPELVARFKPALLGRMVIVPYLPLRDVEIREIVKLKLNKIERRVREQHLAALTYTPQVVELITQRCTEVDTGARNVDHIVTHSMLPELSARVLDLVARGDRLGSAHLSVDLASNFVFDLLAADALEREQRDLRQLLSEPPATTQGLA
ncbi:MAG: clpB2 [Gemmatimonadetes bacterium]|nr:clpB2 [Gemmatimonadota bacterium]